MKEKCRYLVLTDLNPSCMPLAEKDDIQSLIRLLLYSNEIDLEGIVLNTSCFLTRSSGRRTIKLVGRILDAYEQCRKNLDANASGYPDTAYLRSIVKEGIPVFGKAPGRGFCEEKYRENPGVACILEALRKDDPRPLWVGIWSGANTLAQALWQLEADVPAEEFTRLLSKLRIYSISDQDYSGTWLRKTYGSRLFYIVTPSDGSHRGTVDYCKAVWPGISGDHFTHGSEDGVRNGGFTGADDSLISNEWILKNVRNRGPLGALYPKSVYIMEGDTPAYLGLIPNGLNEPERPDYGGWAGRFRRAEAPEGCMIWDGAADEVTGLDGKLRKSPQAGIWRWREAFQNDFLARLEWSVTPSYDRASHAPVPDVQVCRLDDRMYRLDASGSSSPDGAALTCHWFLYDGPGKAGKACSVTGADTAVCELRFGEPGEYHVILEVSGARSIRLTRYARIILTVT